jgi:hypothetical protein
VNDSGFSATRRVITNGLGLILLIGNIVHHSTGTNQLLNQPDINESRALIDLKTGVRYTRSSAAFINTSVEADVPEKPRRMQARDFMSDERVVELIRR